ncbi:MAG: DEAD/DEAH box helicase [SAR202 cluster bacterium]|nr:DEAD/DEAH box helicase [SAR202 cluster bacterium]
MNALAIQDSLSLFHPVIQRWFQGRFSSPTPPQSQGWPAIASGRDTLIAAPTGSGKTLATFLWAIDSLLRQGLDGSLADECQVLYVSPLKALSNDVQKNLAQPLDEIRQGAAEMGIEVPEIRVLVRTGDTPASQRQAMTRKPPHILVSTPESLYILLTSKKGREMLKTVRTVIVDEIHAVARDKRGSHLALTLERLDALTGHRPARIGLSATQKPIDEVARFLVGAQHIDASGQPDCFIVNQGHGRVMNLRLELPGSPLEAVLSNKTWEEIYDRLAQLIQQQRTTLVFVNTRRLAERVAFNLTKRLGEGNITSHHGSLSREQRLMAEERLKSGQLKALVATASLELGIDISAVDLVCQLSSPRSIATLLQRVGRSNHHTTGVPVGRIFPLTRDDLLECVAILLAVKSGNLDRLNIPQKPLDILAQQIVAAVATNEWDEDELFDLCRRAYPYRSLQRSDFDQVLQMLSQGFATKNGRRSAYIHYDGVGRRLRARRNASLAAVTSGGAIPDTADYQVILEPQNIPVGTVNEDFAVESMAGDIFQLGISSWRVLKVEQGKVRVEDAHGMPPTMPFWLGEAPSRTDELSKAVSDLRHHIDGLLPDLEAAQSWLIKEVGIQEPAARLIVEYIAANKSSLGVVPTQQSIVLERFFDESGGMQLVVHAPFGGRINRAWGLALRKRFCRTFNFELQAAANDNSIVLSLGPQHSFPLQDVFDYLKPATARDVLVQALLAAPMFGTRWRWDASRALAILRMEGGKKVPMPIQRMRSDDLLSAVFPDQMACQENLAGGDIQIPDHPLINETVNDCLTEAMDVNGFLSLIQAIHDRRLQLSAVDTIEASPMAHEILTARPYAYLDDAPLEERRTQAVYLRRTLDIQSSDDVGRLDPEAIQRVREQAWPDVNNPDELHDALLLLGFITLSEMPPWQEHLASLLEQKRATRFWTNPDHSLWVAAERLPQFQAVFPGAHIQPPIQAPSREAAVAWTPEDALREIVRGRLEGLGPLATHQIAASLGVEEGFVMPALVALEAQGFALRGRFSPGANGSQEWCDRRLLARIHRYTLDRLRQEIEPVSASDFLRFLFNWHHIHPDHRLDGPTGLIGLLELLEGYEAPALTWERHILPSRMRNFNQSWLDNLCLSGELAWARLHPGPDTESPKSGVTRSLPVSLLFRDHLDSYLALSPHIDPAAVPLSGIARQIMELLQTRGACFFQELVQNTRQLPGTVQEALSELVSWGLITCDGFAGLRALVSPVKSAGTHRLRQSRVWRMGIRPADRMASGRWSILNRTLPPSPLVIPAEAGIQAPPSSISNSELVEFSARQLLKRYGIVFHRLLLRENGAPPWRDLVRVYRRLEARGEIRGGRFVAGFSGEQYALPQAVDQLRATRRAKPDGGLTTVTGSDPLNLVGILTPGQRVPSLSTNRILYRDGVPVGVKVGGKISYLEAFGAPLTPDLEAALKR